jgi:tripartite-type tricarboxylate transporter receptor subunit TctC
MITGPLGTGLLVKAGKIKALAVTSEERSSYFSEMPGVKEFYSE